MKSEIMSSLLKVPIHASFAAVAPIKVFLGIKGNIMIQWHVTLKRDSVIKTMYFLKII